jgi:hypothetical protein
MRRASRTASGASLVGGVRTWPGGSALLGGGGGAGFGGGGA